MKWWIVEDALKDDVGHYFEYVRVFRNELLSLGDEVKVFCERGASNWLIEELAAKPALPSSIWRKMSAPSSKLRKLARFPAHGTKTYASLARIWRSESAKPDIIFVPSVFTHHLIGWLPWVWKNRSHLRQTRVLLFFPSVPITCSPETQKAALKPDPSAALFPFLLKKFRPMVESGMVILGVETRSMKHALEAITGLPFTYFPHPVSFPVTTSSSQAGSPLLAAYGSARAEKGSDVLQAAIQQVLSDDPTLAAQFAIQWLNDFDGEDGRRVEQSEALNQDKRFSYISHYFDPDGGYEEALKETSAVLLPYRDSYRYRLSRVVIEAMICGLPALVSPHTTLAEQLSDYGEGVVVEDLSVDSVATGIRRLVEELPTLSQAAREKAPAAAEHFSVRTFRSILLESIPWEAGCDTDSFSTQAAFRG